MDSREAILSALRRAARPSPEPSAPAFEALRFGDPAAAFAESLAAAGGRCHRLADSAAAAALGRLSWLAGAADLWSAVPGLASRREPPPGGDPRGLSDLDVAVLSGELAVAESGAVWVVPPDPLARAALFLAERVALAVPRERLVDNLHQAYARLPVPLPAFGCFVSGPSKTADIEQCLVIGAQGPRELHVVLFGEG